MMNSPYARLPRRAVLGRDYTELEDKWVRLKETRLQLQKVKSEYEEARTARERPALQLAIAIAIVSALTAQRRQRARNLRVASTPPLSSEPQIRTAADFVGGRARIGVIEPRPSQLVYKEGALVGLSAASPIHVLACLLRYLVCFARSDWTSAPRCHCAVHASAHAAPSRGIPSPFCTGRRRRSPRHVRAPLRAPPSFTPWTLTVSC
jgi:hypothetical protein